MKSTPLDVERVEHVIASLPVTVKVIVPDELVAADAARVTVGGVVSRIPPTVSVALLPGVEVPRPLTVLTLKVCEV